MSFELNDSASVIEFAREGYLAEPTGRRRTAAATALGDAIRAQF